MFWNTICTKKQQQLSEKTMLKRSCCIDLQLHIAGIIEPKSAKQAKQGAWYN